MSRQEYYSHGKLMICGEYAVLNGSTAFALPTKKGQWLRVESREQSSLPLLEWKAYDCHGNIWFEAGISLNNLFIEYSSDQTVAIQLMRFLINAKALNKNFLSGSYNIRVETELEFETDEGLGSSSTLTNNIAQWAGVNPFSLHFNAFKGSAYDVAVALKGRPLLYTMNGNEPVIEEVSWDKPFLDRLYFVHLNRKQNSREQIASYRRNMNTAQIAQISRISRLLSVNDDFFEFCLLLELAESEISQLIGIPPVKTQMFPDFHGTIKSLGAWGGDYVLAASEHDVKGYFSEKGFKRVIPFNEMIK